MRKTRAGLPGQHYYRRQPSRCGTPHNRCPAVPSGKNVALRSLAILLLQTILQTDLGVAAYEVLDLVEVNDDVVALRYAQAEAGDLYWFGQEVAVVSNNPEWITVLGLSGSVRNSS